MLPFKTIREQCDDDVVDDHLDSEEGKIVNLRHQDVLNNYMVAIRICHFEDNSFEIFILIHVA